MARNVLTDEQVEIEIEKLKDDEFVKLCLAEERYRNRRRMLLYKLRSYQKKGKALAESGFTMENFKDFGDEDDA